MIAEQFPALLALPDQDQLQLAAELIQNVINDSDSEDSDPVLETLIGTRLAEYRANPDQVSSWSDVKARLLARRA